MTRSKRTDAFDFDELPPTLNRMLSSHWRTRSNAKKRWTLLLREKLGPDYRCPEPCEILVTWRVMRAQDNDNAKGRFKCIGDALQRAGYISNDDPDTLHLAEPKQIVVKHLSEQGFTMEIREYLPFSDSFSVLIPRNECETLGVYGRDVGDVPRDCVAVTTERRKAN